MCSTSTSAGTTNPGAATTGTSTDTGAATPPIYAM